MNLHAAYNAIGQNPQAIKPYGNYITIILFETTKESEGGIILPGQVQDNEKQTLAWAVRVGNGQVRMDGSARIAPTTVPGDLLLVLKHAPVEMKIGKGKFHTIAEGDVVGKIDLDELATVDPEAVALLREMQTRVLGDNPFQIVAEADAARNAQEAALVAAGN